MTLFPTIHWLLGMRCTYTRGTASTPGRLELDQQAYLRDILDRFEMTACKPKASLPQDLNNMLPNEGISDDPV